MGAVPEPRPGWPRPRRPYDPERYQQHGDRKPGVLPVPWIVGDDWTVFHPQADRAHHERLCQVCGLSLGAVVVLGAHGGDSRTTSGPGCHPRCMALAVQHCPHFDTDPGSIVAYRYDGTGTGYVQGDRIWGYDGPYACENDVDPSCHPLTRAQVRELAKSDPLGLASSREAVA